MLKDYYIGDLVAGDGAGATDAVAPAPAAAAPAATNQQQQLVTLNPREKVTLRLTERIEVSHNTRIFRFALPSPQHVLGLPVGRHLLVYASVDGAPVARAYTPISCDDDVGRLDLLIKVYRAGEHPAFPQGGKMSQHLDRLAVGDTIQVKGPTGHFVYQGKGQYIMHGKQHGTATCLSMVAGGTGACAARKSNYC